MRNFVLTVLASITFAWPAAQATAAESESALPASAVPDYTVAANWACRPGAETACTSGLDAIAISADGARQPDPFVAAQTPAIDCFYVYPTVSHEPSDYSDLAPSPEVMATIRSQAGRLAARCRLFAPLYRQATLAHLRATLADGAALNWDGPYRDILAAWRTYLARDNHGRGVVLIGHSQGTILLQRLIHDQIDGQPAQALLVSAFLAGDPGLLVPAGNIVGGTFAHIPVCSTAVETGCAYVWGSYLSDDQADHRRFGHSPGAGTVAACVSPAAPGGGSASLASYFSKPSLAPAADPPWIKVVGQLSGACISDPEGDVLRVTVEPGRYADLLRPMLEHVVHGGWGLHTLDVALVQGNIVEVIGAEATTWEKAHRR